MEAAVGKVVGKQSYKRQKLDNNAHVIDNADLQAMNDYTDEDIQFWESNRVLITLTTADENFCVSSIFL